MVEILFVLKMEVEGLSQREQHGFEERSAVERKLQSDLGRGIRHDLGIGGIQGCQIGVVRLRQMAPSHHLGAEDCQGVAVQENEFAVGKLIGNVEESIVKVDWILQQQPWRLADQFALLGDELF